MKPIHKDDMKLMIVTPSFAGGGAERIAVNLANHYANQGIDIVLVAFNGKGPYKNQVNKNVEFVDLNTRLRSSFFKIRKEIKKQKPTHILSVLRGGNIILGLSLFFYRKPRLIFREATTLDEVTRKTFIKRWWEITKLKLGYIRSDGVIANSIDTKADLLKFNIKGVSRISVISNPVLPVNFKKLASFSCEHRWLKGDHKVILNIGRLHPLKNQKALIELFPKVLNLIPDARLLIIGEGELRNELVSLIKQLNIQDYVEILPFQQNPWPYYANSSVFALASEWEGFGNVLVEALACGTPVVSINCPGGPKTILDNGKFGVLIEQGDNQGFVEAIAKILTGDIGFDTVALEARGEEFSVENISKKYLNYIVEGK